MKWFVYKLIREKLPSKILCINARTRNAANKRLMAHLERFKLVGTTESLSNEPFDTLSHCQHKFGPNVTMVYKDE